MVTERKDKLKVLENKIDFYTSLNINYWPILNITIKKCQDRYKELTWSYYILKNIKEFNPLNNNTYIG